MRRPLVAAGFDDGRCFACPGRGRLDLLDRITFGRLSWSGPPGASDGGGGSGGDDIVGKESDEASAPPPSDGRLRIERRPGVMRPRAPDTADDTAP